MAQATVIADASAIICLGWVDRLQVLSALFGRIVVPPAVAAEASYHGAALPDWVDVPSAVRWTLGLSAQTAPRRPATPPPTPAASARR
jgi:predicted nucleic acid-binding protein